MHIIFVNRFFYPDHSATSQMLSDLAFELPNDGRKITVVTSRQIYDAPKTLLASRETINGVDVHRIWTTRFGRFHLIGRAVDYVTFYISSALAIWRLARIGDVVVAKTDPPLLSVALAPIVWWRSAKLVNWLQDIFPEVGQSLGVGKGRIAAWLYGGLASLRNWSLRVASANVVLGARMAKHVTGIGIDSDRIHLLPNWADGTLVHPVEHFDNMLRRRWELDGCFVVGYSGNLGRAHEYETLIEAIAIAERDEKSAAPARSHSSGERSTPRAGGQIPMHWLFIGGGVLFEAFKSEVARRGFQTVQFQPYQPRDVLAESLSVPDVHIVMLRPELEGLIVPSKIYGIAAVARPTIFIGDIDGEIPRLLRRADCGLTVEPGDSARLVHELKILASSPEQRRKLGENARSIFLAEYDKSIALRRWITLLESL